MNRVWYRAIEHKTTNFTIRESVDELKAKKK